MVRASAPGRVNLIGEHTDYHGGYVMPIASPQETIVELRRRADRTVVASSANVPSAEREMSYVLGAEQRVGAWVDYVAGVTASLAAHGAAFGGFDVHIASTLPLGGGLSSSASLEIALLRAIDRGFALGLDPVTMAQIGRRAETDFVGAPVGIMDQMAASLADTAAALFLDTTTLIYERLPLPAASSLIVIHSGITHRHAGGEYRVRRRECDEAARQLGVGMLRSVDRTRLDEVSRLPEPLNRRARHVVTENDRVLRARDALRSADTTAFGDLMDASHASMRDDFQISTPEIDALVAIARDDSAVCGARLTGGGFGGSIVALGRADGARESARRIADAYAARVALRPTILIPAS